MRGRDISVEAGYGKVPVKGSTNVQDKVRLSSSGEKARGGGASSKFGQKRH